MAAKSKPKPAMVKREPDVVASDEEKDEKPGPKEEPKKETTPMTPETVEDKIMENPGTTGTAWNGTVETRWPCVVEGCAERRKVGRGPWMLPAPGMSCPNCTDFHMAQRFSEPAVNLGSASTPTGGGPSQDHAVPPPPLPPPPLPAPAPVSHNSALVGALPIPTDGDAEEQVPLPTPSGKGAGRRARRPTGRVLPLTTALQQDAPTPSPTANGHDDRDDEIIRRAQGGPDGGNGGAAMSRVPAPPAGVRRGMRQERPGRHPGGGGQQVTPRTAALAMHAAAFGQGVAAEGFQPVPPQPGARHVVICCFHSRRVGCRFGDRCRYIHDRISAPVQLALSLGQAVLVCADVARKGYCKRRERGEHP